MREYLETELHDATNKFIKIDHLINSDHFTIASTHQRYWIIQQRDALAQYKFYVQSHLKLIQ
jgi:hypothetical protein